VKPFAFFAALALAGCTLGSDLRETVHETLSTGGNPIVRVTNVVGEIRVGTWKRDAVDVQAVKSARTLQDLNRIAIDAHSEGRNVTITTRYSGGTGGGVSYTLLVPPAASLAISNITGTVDVRGTLGDVSVTTQTGEIAAQLGRVAGNRVVDLGATTGSVKLSIAADSSVRVDASSTIGSFSSDFPAVSMSRTNLVGIAAMGTIGSGSAAIRLHTTTGSIELQQAR
jgi:Putative adhesin